MRVCHIGKLLTSSSTNEIKSIFQINFWASVRLFFIAGAFGPLAVRFAQEFNVNACNFANIYCLREA